MKQALAITALLAAVAIGGLQGCAGTPTAKADDKHRIVFHVTDGDATKWNIVLNNAGNVQDALGRDKVIIEIVTHGPGINMLKAESTVAPRLAQALDRNVGLVACEFTMRQAKVTKADMYAGISYAPSGVTRIIQRQEEGWIYLRP
jgi:intracellular sulfur oxidation DsrE/DsrF family protein